jgi:hypothetical protein
VTVRSDGAHRAGRDAELALQARFIGDRRPLLRRREIGDDRAQQDEVAEPRMNHVPVQAHPAEAGGDRDGLVRHDPGSSGGPLQLHRESGRRVDCAVPSVDQCTDDAAADPIALVDGVVELQLGEGARWSPDAARVHAHHVRDERARARERGEHLGALIGHLRAVDAHEADVGGARLEAQRPQLGDVDGAGGALTLLLDEADGGMRAQLHEVSEVVGS